MSDALSIHDIQALYDLKNALSRFAKGTQESLDLIETKITDSQNWLEERLRYWGRETDKAQRNVEEASENLRRCHLSGYRDADGYYHQPDCSTESIAVRFAENHLRVCRENFEKTKVWQSKIEQAVSDYRLKARRLSNIAASHTEKAQAFLVQTAGKYEKVKTSQESILSFPPNDPPPAPADSPKPNIVSSHSDRRTKEKPINYENSVETQPTTAEASNREFNVSTKQDAEKSTLNPPEGGSSSGLERGR